MVWHAHEMIYGFSAAILAGFVLTAIQNWTGIRGIHGRNLQILVLAWVLGRVGFLFPTRLSPFFALVDLGFFPLLGIYLIPYFRDPELKVERIFYGYFSLFFIGN